jgi:uncharacterized protein (DUF1810 family)
MLRRKKSKNDDIEENQDDQEDPHNLVNRFVANQQIYFAKALCEIKQGKKQGHWLWFILPTDPFIVNGRELGSEMNRAFALRGDAAEAYLETDSLRSNYFQICKAIECQLQFGNSMQHLFGPLDSKKVVSSWNLFRATALKLGDDELANLCHSLLQFGAVKNKEKGKKRNNNYFIL